jgi:hypothetical protein
MEVIGACCGQAVSYPETQLKPLKDSQYTIIMEGSEDLEPVYAAILL